jgi:DNA-binding NarL/FixJ family response regulator
MAASRILIVEDHEGLRALLRSLLENETQCVVIGEASDGLLAVQRAQELQPDLILLDLSLPKLNGLEAGRRIRKISPHSKILFLSQEPAPEIVQSALRIGAGYLLKSDAKELPAAVHAVLEGRKFVSDRLKAS